MVLIRLNKSEMLPFGRFEILEAGTIGNILIGSLNKASYKMMACSFNGLSKCFHTTACRELNILALMTWKLLVPFNLFFKFYRS